MILNPNYSMVLSTNIVLHILKPGFTFNFSKYFLSNVSSKIIFLVSNFQKIEVDNAHLISIEMASSFLGIKIC